MGTLKCLACGHDNNVGDESCSSCSSSLNLKLCSACEAINAHSAKHCHSCKAEFGAEPELAAVLEADAPPRAGEMPEAALVGKALPDAWRLAADRARKRGKNLKAILWLAPLVAAAGAYFVYAVPSPAQKPPVAQKLEATAKSAEPASQPQAAPKEPARPQPAEVKPAQVPSVSGKIAPAKTAPAPVARPVPSASDPKRANASIAHTSNAAPAAAIATPGAMPERRYTPVTHTKPVVTEAAAATTAPVVTNAAATASEGRSTVAETRNDEPAACSAAVAALGLCKSK